MVLRAAQTVAVDQRPLAEHVLRETDAVLEVLVARVAELIVAHSTTIDTLFEGTPHRGDVVGIDEHVRALQTERYMLAQCLFRVFYGTLATDKDAALIVDLLRSQSNRFVERPNAALLNEATGEPSSSIQLIYILVATLACALDASNEQLYYNRETQQFGPSASVRSMPSLAARLPGQYSWQHDGVLGVSMLVWGVYQASLAPAEGASRGRQQPYIVTLQGAFERRGIGFLRGLIAMPEFAHDEDRDVLVRVLYTVAVGLVRISSSARSHTRPRLLSGDQGASALRGALGNSPFHAEEEGDDVPDAGSSSFFQESSHPASSALDALLPPYAQYLEEAVQREERALAQRDHYLHRFGGDSSFSSHPDSPFFGGGGGGSSGGGTSGLASPGAPPAVRPGAPPSFALVPSRSRGTPHRAESQSSGNGLWVGDRVHDRDQDQDQDHDAGSSPVDQDIPDSLEDLLALLAALIRLDPQQAFVFVSLGENETDAVSGIPEKAFLETLCRQIQQPTPDPHSLYLATLNLLSAVAATHADCARYCYRLVTEAGLLDTFSKLSTNNTPFSLRARAAMAVLVLLPGWESLHPGPGAFGVADSKASHRTGT